MDHQSAGLSEARWIYINYCHRTFPTLYTSPPSLKPFLCYGISSFHPTRPPEMVHKPQYRGSGRRLKRPGSHVLDACLSSMAVSLPCSPRISLEPINPEQHGNEQ